MHSINTTSESVHHTDERLATLIGKTLDRRSFAMLSTVSPAGHPHAAGVLFETVDGVLYVHTRSSSRKARNIASDGRVAVVVSTRKMPFGPPFTVQFQARAEIVAMDDPAIVELLDRGELSKISDHGALDMPDGCFIRIVPGDRVHTYGLGVSMMKLARDPLNEGARTVDMSARN